MNNASFFIVLVILLHIVNNISGVQHKSEFKRQENLKMEERLSHEDPHSYANPEAVRTNHIHIELEIDFNKTQLHGKVILYLSKNDINAKTVKIDGRGLKIWSIYYLDGINGSVPLNWKFTESYVASMLSELGDLIEITLPDLKKHHIFRIEITYETKPCQRQLDVDLGHCDGLYWQRNKKMFYSVGQAIFTRQLIPCQDTPTAKTTYTAVITAPEELKVLMSASEIESDKNGTGKRRTLFNQRKPIPTYLIVLAIGNFKRYELIKTFNL